MGQNTIIIGLVALAGVFFLTQRDAVAAPPAPPYPYPLPNQLPPVDNTERDVGIGLNVGTKIVGTLADLLGKFGGGE